MLAEQHTPHVAGELRDAMLRR